ncbi:MAG TPA: hypothetical protein VF392_16590 [Terracidiphilus sp.]
MAQQPAPSSPAATKPAQAQTPARSTASTPAPATHPAAATPDPNIPAASTDQSQPEGDAANAHQLIVTTPPPPPVVWSWHDRVLWGAYVVLAILGYIAIMIGLRALRSIERQSAAAAATAKAALDSATAALMRTQAVVDAERPWIVVTVEPFLTMENAFKVLATNRGHTPAKLTVTIDQVAIAADETLLPATPQFQKEDANSLPEPVILLPGESVGIRPFSRDEVTSICKTKEELERIELWEEKIFLYGRVTYRQMIESETAQEHETVWCCRYIHGESKSALLMTGPPPYNKHT